MQIEFPIATRERPRDHLVVASLSGGKDSTAHPRGARAGRLRALPAAVRVCVPDDLGLGEQSPASSAPAPSGPAPTSPARHVIGHDHLVSLGAPAETIAAWLAAGILKPTEHDGFYERTPETDKRMAVRRIVGRGHLLALGATNSLIARWLRRGVLQATAERGFYSIVQVAFDGLRVGAKSAGVPGDPLHPVGEAPSPPAATKPDNLRIGPCTISQARAYVARHHRHLGPPVSGLPVMRIVLESAMNNPLPRPADAAAGAAVHPGERARPADRRRAGLRGRVLARRQGRGPRQVS